MDPNDTTDPSADSTPDPSTPATFGSVQKQIKDAINVDNQFSVKKYGDTPTDALQLVPKKYVDVQTSIFNASIVGLRASVVAVTNTASMLLGSVIGIESSIAGGMVTPTATFTAGAAVGAGVLVGTKFNDTANWGDDASAGKNTVSVLSSFKYVDSHAGHTTDALSPTQPVVNIAADGAGQYQAFGVVNITGSPQPGLPTWDQSERIKLRLYNIFGTGSGTGFALSRVTQSFTPSALTWNNRPSDDGFSWANGAVCSTILGEAVATTGDGTTAGYLEFDISQLYRHWSLGTFSNNGFVIKATAQNGGATQFGGITRAGGGFYNQEPYAVATIVTSVASQVGDSGQVYPCDITNYNTVRNVIGVTRASAAGGASVAVYKAIEGEIIPGTYANGISFYLADSAGTIGSVAGGVSNNGFSYLPVGIGTPQGLKIKMTPNVYMYNEFLQSVAGNIPPYGTKRVVISGTSSMFSLEKPFITQMGLPVGSVVWGSGAGEIISGPTAGPLTLNYFS